MHYDYVFIVAVKIGSQISNPGYIKMLITNSFSLDKMPSLPRIFTELEGSLTGQFVAYAGWSALELTV